MKKVLIATHGNLAQGMLSSVELLTGSTEGISVINAYTEDIDLEEKIDEFINEIQEEQVFIFTDLFGGSVNQKVTSKFLEQNIPATVISGFNFPVLLEILIGEGLTPEKVEKLVENSRQELKSHLITSVTRYTDNEEDFFK